ncbi:SDR family oxidoreductase [Streptococcus pneumoniae]
MRRIVITGASGGLAQAVEQLLPEDYLILVGRSMDKLEQLYGNHPNRELIELDITDSEALERFTEECLLKHGPIDILINNAGYGLFEDFDQISSRDIEEMFQVNTFATMNLSRLFAKQMKEVRKGQIINIVSMAGLIASGKSTLYSATKFAVIGFSNALRLELRPYHVFVTTVNPGPIQTAFFDQADPEGTYLQAVKAYLLEPEFVAKKIVASFGTKKREINLPWLLNLAYKCYTLFPRLGDFLASNLFNYK